MQAAGKRASYPHRYSTDSEDAPRIRDQANRTLAERWQIVERHLAENGPYHLGERFSLVDLYLAMTVGWFRPDVHPLSLEALPAVKRCYELVEARPRCGPILARHIEGLGEILRRGPPE